MKNYNEMANDVINRVNKSDSNQKRKRKILTGTVTSLCCVCLLVLIGFCVRQSGWFDSAPPILENHTVYNGDQDSLSETSKNTANSTGEDSMSVFNVISLSQDSRGGSQPICIVQKVSMIILVLLLH